MQSIEKDRRKSGLGKPHNIILANFSLVSKTPKAAVQAADKTAELDSSLFVTHSIAPQVTPSREKNEAVGNDCVALIRTAVTFIRLSPNDRNIPQGAHLQFMKGFNYMNLLKETNIPFVEN